MVLQRDGGVRLGHGDELALAAALGCKDLHATLCDAAQPSLDQLAVGDVFGDEHLGGRCHRLGVELTDERREDVAVGPAGDLVEEERLLPDEPALAYEEQLDARVVALAHHAEDVLIDLVGGDDLLALAHLVERLDLIAQHRRPLELLLSGRLLHLACQRQREIVVLALEEALDVAGGLGVALAGLPPRARRVAAVDRVLDAWPRQRAVDLDRAGAQREELAGQPQRDRKSTRLNSSHMSISYAVFCLKKKK